MDHVCADCGRRTDKKHGPCAKCNGFRIISIAFVEKTFGLDWMSAFDEDAIEATET